MSLNVDRVWAAISDFRSSSLPIESQIHRVIQACEDSYPHDDWQEFRKVDFEKGAQKVRDWLRGLLESEPPSQKVAALWFGLINLVDEHGAVSADVYCAGAESYDPSDADCEWAEDCTYFPAGRFANSTSLDQIYRLAYAADTGLGNEAEWSLSLAFSVAALCSTFSEMTSEDIPGSSDTIGLAVGFDSGDLLRLGELTSTGFVPCTD